MCTVILHGFILLHNEINEMQETQWQQKSTHRFTNNDINLWTITR